MTTTLRVLSYNIRSLRDDPAAVARVVRACRPDVVCLQEAPRLLWWRARRRRLALRCGLRVAVSRRAGGLAVLVRPGIAVRHRAHRRLRRHRGLPARALSSAVLSVGTRRVTVAVSHLDLHPGARMEHAAQVLGLLGTGGPPVVLAVDVNEEPHGPVWRLLADRLIDTGGWSASGDAPTFPARRPRRRIDGVFADPRLRVVHAGVPTEPSTADLAAATDHRPVLAVLDLPRPR